jgi:hypothetical protein
MHRRGPSTTRIELSVCDSSAKRFAPTARRGRQDDGLVVDLKMQLVGYAFRIGTVDEALCRPCGTRST